MRKLRPSDVSRPALSGLGYHLIRMDAAEGESLHVRHILVSIVLQGAHLDAVEARADTLERLAAAQIDGGRLDRAGHALNLPLAHAPRLVEGDRLTLGRYVIPDVSVWAFEARPGETSPLIEGEVAYYVFRLDSLTPAGVPPLAEIRDRVRLAAQLEKKRAVAQHQAEVMARALAGVSDLLKASTAHPFTVRQIGPFTRLTPPGQLRSEPVVVGAAFGLRPGERSRLIVGEQGFFLLEGVGREPADSAAWLAQRDTQREALLQAAQQARVQAYLAALRARAKIVDRRKEVFQPQSASRS